ncbi:MAG: hypothetical protein VXX31_07550 [Planctomycetota bacterium]|nr:hypothetical protein [Planctomycetota bacterium]
MGNRHRDHVSKSGTICRVPPAATHLSAAFDLELPRYSRRVGFWWDNLTFAILPKAGETRTHCPSVSDGSTPRLAACRVICIRVQSRTAGIRMPTALRDTMAFCRLFSTDPEHEHRRWAILGLSSLSSGRESGSFQKIGGKCG